MPSNFERPHRPHSGSRLAPGQAARLAAFGLLAAIVVGLGVLGAGGITEVKDNQVAVVVNHVTGSMEVHDVAGNKIYTPFVEQVFTLDKSPNKFVMEGNVDRSTDHVRELTVRARDGSNFWFDTIEIQYQLVAGQAAVVLQDSGVGDAFKKLWLMSYARSILRDEFGRFDAEEISNPANYSNASIEAQKRLNAALHPHGIDVRQITIPKPKFATEYEKAIQDRKLADQEVERLKAQALQLEKEKAKRLAEIDSDLGQRFAALRGELAAQKTQAEAEKIKLEREADAYKIERSAAGEAERLAAIEEARGLTEKYQKEAQGLKAKTEALARQGRMVVVEALAQKLAGLELEITPYQRSPAPTRIEVEPAAAAAASAASAAERR